MGCPDFFHVVSQRGVKIRNVSETNFTDKGKFQIIEESDIRIFLHGRRADVLVHIIDGL